MFEIKGSQEDLLGAQVHGETHGEHMLSKKSS